MNEQSSAKDKSTSLCCNDKESKLEPSQNVLYNSHNKKSKTAFNGIITKSESTPSVGNRDDSFDYQRYIDDIYDQSSSDYDHHHQQNIDQQYIDDIYDQSSRYYDYHHQQNIEAWSDGFDSSELEVEKEMSIMITRDEYGFPFYESMGDNAFRDERDGFNPDDYTTGNWKLEQEYRRRNGPYIGPPQEEWSQKSVVIGDLNSDERHQYSNGNDNNKIGNTDRNEAEENYLMGSNGVNKLRVSDIVELQLKEPQERFKVLNKIHQELILGYEGVDCKGKRYYGPKMNLIMRKDVAERIVERLPIVCNSCQVQLWYLKLSMFLVHYKYNIALMPFEYIDMNLGSVGICIPGVGRRRYNEMGKALAMLLTSKLLPCNRCTGLEKCTYNETLDMVRRNKRDLNGYDILYSLLSEIRFKT